MLIHSFVSNIGMFKLQVGPFQRRDLVHCQPKHAADGIKCGVTGKDRAADVPRKISNVWMAAIRAAARGPGVKSMWAAICTDSAGCTQNGKGPERGAHAA